MKELKVKSNAKKAANVAEVSNSVTAEHLEKLLEEKILRRFGCRKTEVTKQQIFRAVCSVVRDIMNENKLEFDEKAAKQSVKKVYYMSMEFLVGPSLENDLAKLCMTEQMAKAVESFGYNLDELCKMDPDAGLGNGGLGRLASCYMDSASSKDLSFTGFSLRYEFGIFKQKIVDGWQVEFPDNWLELGQSWLAERPDDAVEVKFDGHITEEWDGDHMKIKHIDYNSVIAVPHDMLIPGYNTKSTNALVLWSAKSPQSLDFEKFSRGEFLRSVENNTMAEAITKVLYPADDHWSGKELRLKQQYLLVCASINSILKEFIKEHGVENIEHLADHVAIHINDTHPSLCVPELMRVLLDDYGFSWDKAWEVTQNTLAYTNHTVMSEALERWPIELFSQKLPRIFSIVKEIDRRFTALITSVYHDDYKKIDYMKILEGNNVKMANLCLACCHKVNGVSKLHSDILVNDLFKDFAYITPDKFTNVTNGIDYRRWLCQANPQLSDLLKECIGDGFMKDASELEKFLKYKDDKAVLDKLYEIKKFNKQRLSQYVSTKNGIYLDDNSLFDIQVKRLHEYKRQLLNVLHIIHLYITIKENPNLDIHPRTFVFAAKASAGYFMAKQIIRLINCVADLVNNDIQTRDKIRVVFVEDYKVSLAQVIIPAADISEQISVAGKEASGTGNMKLMLNGAVTLGTLDGANVEIREQVGDDNIFIFGMTADEVVDLWHKGYNPGEIANSNQDLKKVLDFLRKGINGVDFNDIVYSLTQGSYGSADSYMTLADFDAYKNAQKTVDSTYRNRDKFDSMALVNIAKAGIFAADRSIMEYADNIWNSQRVQW